MKIVYSNENSFLVNNIKNLIEAQNIKTFIKNEFSQGALGEVSVFDAWPELWVFDECDVEAAQKIIQNAKQAPECVEWICDKCSERNDASFEICWQCQQEK